MGGGEGSSIAQGDSQQLIGQLLEAEKKAEDLINSAKKNRLTKLRQAKDKAEEELKVFRDDQDQKFKVETSMKAAADPSSDLKASTDQAVAMVQQDYEANKRKTVDYVASKVLDVVVDLTDTQQQALRTGSVYA